MAANVPGVLCLLLCLGFLTVSHFSWAAVAGGGEIGALAVYYVPPAAVAVTLPSSSCSSLL